MPAQRQNRCFRLLALAAAAVVVVSLAAGDELPLTNRPPDVEFPRQEIVAQLAPLLPFDCQASPIPQSDIAIEKPLDAIHLVEYQAPIGPPREPAGSLLQIRDIKQPPAQLDNSATEQFTRLNMPGYIPDPMLRRLSATGGDDITPRDRDQPQYDYESPVTVLKPTAHAEPPSILSALGPTPDEQLWLGDAFKEGTGGIVLDHGVFRSAYYQQPLAPLQPLQPVQPPTLAPTEPTAPTGAFSALGSVSVAELAAAVGGSPVQGVGAAQAQSLAPTDLGSLLQSAQSVQSVSTTRRSPVALDPNIRGYKFGQVYTQATGAYWFPVREDMDSMLSKIDPGMIQDVIVIPGPYGLRYGPGLAFIDIVTQDTPRYNGSGSDYRANGNIRTNGAQLYGRLTAEGGTDDWGYRISYGHREGDNYLAGNGLQIPSSYDNGDVWAQYGISMSKYQKVEFSYLRLDQNLTNYAAQFFDVNTLETNAGTLRAVDDDPCSPWTKAVLEGWWNRTQFTGSITDSKRDPKFPVIQRVEFSLDQLIPGANIINGDTLGDNTSSGARSVFLFGDTDDAYIRVGGDFHFQQQGLRENFDIENVTFPALSLGKFFTNLPFATLNDGGVFAEYGHPIGDHWDVAFGGRVDWVHTGADPNQVRTNTNLNVDTLEQSDVLYAYYMTNEFKLGNDWKINAGMGYAQRPPNLTERYADGMFLGLLQSGFTRVIGNDQLLPEKDWQMDVGISCNYDNFRMSATYFYAWIVDYATFQGDSVVNFFDARLVRYINTARATLTGFEAVGDWDWSPKFTPFAKMKYVQGQDEVINGPLPSIPPLEGTVGVRWHDCGTRPMWEFEAGERMVTTQDRLGEILILNSPTVVEERTPGFATTYVRGYYNWSKDMKFVAGIDNVFNRSYQEHLDLRLLSPTGFPAPATRVLSPGITPYFAIDWRF